MPLVIPERTIDTLFTFEFISAAPTAIVVSPNNNRGPRTPDHEVEHAHRKFVFECKTVYTAASSSLNWVIRVPRPQLSDYLAHGQASLIYVLPAEPTRRTQPWVRTCRTDPDPRGCCQACSNPTRAHGAIYARRWAGQKQPISSAPTATRLQPWFNHWAWCVRADDLENRLNLNPALTRKVSGVPNALIPADDVFLEGVPGAVRLCHFLAAVQRDHDMIHGANRVDDADQGQPDTSLDDGFEVLERMSIQTIAELESLDDDRRLIVGY